jgi:hypothetical protein
VTHEEALRLRVVDELKRRGLSATPQALLSLIATVAHSDPEFVGDTDTLLAGLLLTGSYTIDVLEGAGADRDALHHLTLASAQDHSRGLVIDPFEGLFPETLIDAATASHGRLESSHILRAAMSLRDGEGGIGGASVTSLMALRADEPARTPMLAELERRVVELMVFVAGGFLTPGRNPVPMLAARRQRLTCAEDEQLDAELGPYCRDMTTEELEWLETAFDSWFANRHILTSPMALCVQLIGRMGGFFFAPEHFLSSGGDLTLVDSGLAVAERVAPTRDHPVLGLFYRDGHIHAGYFTYRDAVAANAPPTMSEALIQGMRIYAPQPVGLIQSTVLKRLEDLISSEHVRESHIQQYLSRHPEVLMSLGYAGVRPHVCLTAGRDQFIPDFILELPGQRGFDILDLKLPRARLSAREPYLRIAADLTKAVAQLRKYAKFFDNPANRRLFETKYGLEAFVPEVIVVIGRSSELYEREDRIEIEAQLGNVRLLTYDDLLAYAQARVITLP